MRGWVQTQESHYDGKRHVRFLSRARGDRVDASGFRFRAVMVGIDDGVGSDCFVAGATAPGPAQTQLWSSEERLDVELEGSDVSVSTASSARHLLRGISLFLHR